MYIVEVSLLCLAHAGKSGVHVHYGDLELGLAQTNVQEFDMNPPIGERSPGMTAAYTRMESRLLQ